MGRRNINNLYYYDYYYDYYDDYYDDEYYYYYYYAQGMQFTYLEERISMYYWNIHDNPQGTQGKH